MVKSSFFYLQVVPKNSCAGSPRTQWCKHSQHTGDHVILVWNCCSTACANPGLRDTAVSSETFVLYTAGNRNESSCWITEICWFISCRSGKWLDDNLLAFFSKWSKYMFCWWKSFYLVLGTIIAFRNTSESYTVGFFFFANIFNLYL